MGLLGLILGLGTASKINDKLHDENDGIVESTIDMGISAIGGSIVKGIADTILDDDEEDEEDDF